MHKINPHKQKNKKRPSQSKYFIYLPVRFFKVVKKPESTIFNLPTFNNKKQLKFARFRAANELPIAL